MIDSPITNPLGGALGDGDVGAVGDAVDVVPVGLLGAGLGEEGDGALTVMVARWSAEDHATGTDYLREPEQLDEYSKLFDRLAENALNPVDVSLASEALSVKDSLALIKHLLYAL
ncbi:hypothetical protein SALBM311S_04947 [Streptomyces alboniger]